ncbi:MULTISPECIES: hypothetical protein [Acinetobacter]|uniref:hypothetical protein n=1 Tax=Acinetobacter TaxID=469 RepID=UPI000993514E|nr:MULTISPECIES: hypothetical protein [Acinetobacter]MCL6245179.1 hypothetical protein [Acinetobacter amyesii]OOV83859.1 hypothetical protein B1201_01025 [Acinetobacter sp. ANC 5600]
MDIQKEREAFEHHLTDTGLVEFAGYGFEVDECDEYLHEPTQVAWDSWLIGLGRSKAQAVLEWIDYTKQSPRIDGRYQIFISGEQITADWQSPFGFSDPVEGEALIQELISHWGMLPEPPKPQESAND